MSETKLICKISFEIEYEGHFTIIPVGTILHPTLVRGQISHKWDTEKFPYITLKIVHFEGDMYCSIDLQTISFCCEEYSEEQEDLDIAKGITLLENEKITQLIKKHLGENTFDWIIKKCMALLKAYSEIGCVPKISASVWNGPEAPPPPFGHRVLVRAYLKDAKTAIFEGGIDLEGWYDWKDGREIFENYIIIDWAEIPK